MRLTTKGRYAVTAMLDIALHRDDGPVSVMDIAERQDISSAYLEQLFSKLKRVGLVVSVRGPGGGYRLQRDPGSVSVSEIISAVGDGVDATRCHGSADCQDGLRCLTHDLWAELSHEIDGYLHRVTLGELVARRGVQHISRRQNEKVDRQDRKPQNQKLQNLIDARHL
jgi:Rrf2 family iron-sulfur cluster assembly transcriptional regulator